MSQTIIAGSDVRVRAQFYDFDGAVVNPTSVTVKIIRPDATEQILAATKVGDYYQVIISTTTPGAYQYRFEAVGTVAVAGEGRFHATGVV